MLRALLHPLVRRIVEGERMNWDFDGEGGWDALSSVGDDGVMFSWRIVVCDDGTFSVNESDDELTDRKETFDTFRDAKTWCAKRDEEFRLACLREDEYAYRWRSTGRERKSNHE